MRRRTTARVGSLVLVASLGVTLTACTGGSHPPPEQPSTITRTVVHTQTPTIDPSPIVAGPTTSATGACPLLPEQTVHQDVGMRLDRQTVQRSGSQVIGCRFYPLTHPNAQCDATCLANEHLPPADQAAVEITLEHYGSATDARNAMILRARKGSGVQQVSVGADGVGLAYQIEFYPADHGRDWACAFTHGDTLAVVKTTTTGTSFNAVAVAKRLAGALT